MWAEHDYANEGVFEEDWYCECGTVVKLLCPVHGSNDPKEVGPWRDRHGDIWELEADGRLYTPETRPFTRAHVERKWGPLVPTEPTISDPKES